MIDPIQRYIENVLARADLSADDEAVVRAELADHLHSLLAAHPDSSPTEAYAMIEHEFGNPNFVGKSIARAKGRLRTYLKKQKQKLPLRLAACVLLAFTVRVAVAEPFYAAGGGVAPLIPQGSSVLVYKWTRTFSPGDVVVFKTPEQLNLLGIVRNVRTDNLLVERNGSPDQTVPLERVVGRVVLNTR